MDKACHGGPLYSTLQLLSQIDFEHTAVCNKFGYCHGHLVDAYGNSQ